MTTNDLPSREEIQEILEKVEDSKKVVEFAWRCAVRVLPLLGHKGNFDFWREEDRQKHLYSVFRALDYSIGYYFINGINDCAYDNPDAYDAYDACEAYQDSYSAVAAAAVAADDDVSAYEAYAYEAAANAASIFRNRNIIELIAEDINVIKDNRDFSPMGGISVYGDLWRKFKTALVREGCNFWAELYEDIFERCVNIEELEIRLNVPKEFKEQGARVVAEYIKELLEGSEILREYRLIIIGDKDAGKTCIARRIIDVDAEMTLPEESTTGINIDKWQPVVENTPYTINIWDFAGHEITHAVHQLFLSSRCLYILVLDGRTENDDPNYWLEHIKTFGGNSPTLVFINEKDTNRRSLYIDRNIYPFVIGAEHRFSVKDDKSKITSFSKDILKVLSTHRTFQLKFPKKYSAIKQRIQEINQTFISKYEMQKLIKEEKLPEEKGNNLLEYLNTLGIALSYKDIDFDFILNPNWITQHIYEIIKNLNDANRHTITKEEIRNVLCNQKENCKGKTKTKDCPICDIEKETNFFFEILKQYRLAYSTKQDENKLVIPSLMSNNQSEDLSEYEKGLQVRYRFPSLLPSNILPLFIVRTYNNMHNSYVWRKGVVLKYDDFNCSVFVREDTEKKIIEIWVEGADKRGMFAVIRNEFNEIYKSITGLEVDLEVYYDKDKKGVHLFEKLENLMNFLAIPKEYTSPVTTKDYNVYNILGDYMTKEEANKEAKTVINNFKFKKIKGDIITGGRKVTNKTTVYNYNSEGLKELAQICLDKDNSDLAMEVLALKKELEQSNEPEKEKKSKVSKIINKSVDIFGKAILSGTVEELMKWALPIN